MAASAALPPLPQQQSQQQPATRRAGIRRIAVFDGVAMVHKPAGLCTHPYREPQRKHSTDPLVCPACGRVYGSDEAWAWHSMHDHLTNSQDATHVEWRAAHPQGLVCEFTAEFTLWHALHDWPGLFDDQAPDEPDGSPSASPSNESAAELASTPAAPQPLQLVWQASGDQRAASGMATPEHPVHIVNRLDRGTSGIILVAQTAELAETLQRDWPTAVTKTYLVMVRGKTAETFTVDRALTDRDTKLKTAPQREAITHFELVRTYGENSFSLLRATLVSGGRKHQIRRHLASVAHQVLGDRQQ